MILGSASLVLGLAGGFTAGVLGTVGVLIIVKVRRGRN